MNENLISAETDTYSADDILQRQEEWKSSNRQQCPRIARLIRHHKIVRSVAREIAVKFSKLGIQIDQRLAEMMAVTHDLGKCVATNELDEPGTKHEGLGKSVALEYFGIDESVSKICQSHGWDTPQAPDGNRMMSKEEIVATLADRLWKGSRKTPFEMGVAESLCLELGKESWEVFMLIDPILEDIADEGAERLARSR